MLVSRQEGTKTHSEFQWKRKVQSLLLAEVQMWMLVEETVRWTSLHLMSEE